MKKLFAATLALLMLLAFAGCQSPTSGGSGDATVRVYNWEDYIDPDAIAAFEEETGIKVVYTNFATNEIMYTKLSRGGGDYDVIVPSDYMIQRLIREDALLELDMAKLPNFSNTFDWLHNPDFDPGSKHSVPYMWGTVGILYNTEKTGGEIDSWGEMWDTKYQRDVLMIDSFRDSMGVTLKYLGYDINTRNVDELNKVRDKLIEQRESGVLLAYGVDEIKDKMVGEEAAMGLVWSGDAITSMELNENLAYCVPKEGSNVWVDSLCIPKSSKNPEAAYQFIDFMMRPEIAAMNSEYIGYSTPNSAAMDILGPDYSQDEVFNPPQEVIDRCQYFHDLGDFVSTYEYIWTEATN